MRWAVGGLVMMVLGFIPVNLVGLDWWPVAFPLWLETIWLPMLNFTEGVDHSEYSHNRLRRIHKIIH
jgi:hypothetical protein